MQYATWELHAAICMFVWSGILLALKADVNLQDKDGESPLHNAARHQPPARACICERVCVHGWTFVVQKGRIM